ncbi:MAG TPA: hypothetical protein VGQ62_24230 [Chloroflexota bacterium]|jgi:hypothetical protein|nr:hypothetical protein [Chloroflexota bacterium]
MTDERREQSAEELAEQEATDLPERENMSLINANIAAPINAALAANVLSDGATAGAGATQADPIHQGMLQPPAPGPATTAPGA